MFKDIRNVLKKNKDSSLLFNDLKKVKGNKNYLDYILNFKKHIINPKEDIEERTYDVINYLRNSKESISNLGKKKIKNGSIILTDNSPLVKEMPWFKQAALPLFFLLSTKMMCFLSAYFFTTLLVLSVLPSFKIITS